MAFGHFNFPSHPLVSAMEHRVQPAEGRFARVQPLRQLDGGQSPGRCQELPSAFALRLLTQLVLQLLEIFWRKLRADKADAVLVQQSAGLFSVEKPVLS